MKKYPLTFDCISKVASTSGIYIISTDFKFSRLKGITDILYIGKANDLHKRLSTFSNGFEFCKLKKHLKNRPVYKRRHAIWRFWDLYCEGYQLFFSTKKSKSPKKQEKSYLGQYHKKHLELPPLNHSH
jgi:hypothetical protein